MNTFSNNLWKERKVFDMWNLNQFLGGLVLAGILLKFNLSLTLAILIGFIITLSWEIYELTKNMYEAPLNKLLDIFTTVLGIYTGYYLVSLNLIQTNVLLTVSLIIFVSLEIWGFLSIATKN